MVRVFAKGPGDLGSIPGQVIPKTKEMVLNASLHYIKDDEVRIKGNSGKWVVPFPTPWCNSYRKGSLSVTLDYGRQLYITIRNSSLCICVWLCKWLKMFSFVFSSRCLSVYTCLSVFVSECVSVCLKEAF